MNSYEMAKRQNEDTSLKIQYAARCCFNSAEIYNNLTWLCCFVSLFSVFLPDTISQNTKSVIPFAFDILAAFFAVFQIQRLIKELNYASILILMLLEYATMNTPIRKYAI